MEILKCKTRGGDPDSQASRFIIPISTRYTDKFIAILYPKDILITVSSALGAVGIYAHHISGLI